MKFGSVCSGIEAASVAWGSLGWKAAWLAEIEPFPSAVLAHHYPDIPNLGDMTKLPERIASGEVEAPDLFCGGTPCQAFSVAGNRKSLDDARGNLSLTFCEIANAIDDARLVRGEQPSIVFWENVPGVLSTKDNAFGCFLAQLCGGSEPLHAPGGWTNAGCVSGPKRTAAWRVLDAQYFGVAQRRRRVFVVASARNDFDPAAVLFEFDGVRRDIAPSREARKDPSSGTGKGSSGRGWPAEVSSTLDTTFGAKQGLEDQHVNNGCPLFVPVSPSIVHGTQDPCVSDIAFAQGCNNGGENVLVQPISIHPHCIGRAPNAGPQGKEYLMDGSAYCMDSRGHPQAVAQPISYAVRTANTNANGHGISPEMAHTLDSVQGQAVAQPIPIDMRNAGRDPEKHDEVNRQGVGVGKPGDPAHTVTSAFVHGVAQPINIYGGNKRQDRPEGGFYVRTDEDTSKTLDAATGLNPTCSQGGTAVMQYIGGVDYENNAHTMDQPTGPLLKGSPTGGGRPLPAIATAMQVRRLTPVECERLQGFPDGYTNIPWRKKDESPDGPRYKALGNSWAVPNVAWIGKRIQSVSIK